MNLPGPPESCPLCAVAPRRGLRLANGADLLQCPRCRLAWWGWPAFEPGAFYDRDYFQSNLDPKGYADYAALEPGIRRTAVGRLLRLERLLRRGGRGPARRADQAGAPRVPETRPATASGGGRRLLDVGCGTGVFLDEARRRGWTGRGIEVSAYAAAAARDRGFDVHCGTIESADLPPAAFDAVTLWDTIEHLADPVGAVARLAGALRPGGVFAISTGDVTSWCARLSGARWHLFNLPEHLFFFSPASLRGVLTQAGCQVADTVREVNWAPWAYLRERLVKTVLRRAPRPATRPSKLVLPATLFDVLGVYAVRR